MRRFSHELARAWAVFRDRWVTAVKVALLPFAALFLLLPYLVESAALREHALQLPALDLALLTPSLFTTVLAGGSLLAFFLASIVAKAALYHAFSAPEDPGAARAYALALRRFPSFFITTVFTVGLVTLFILAALAVFAYYRAFIRPTVLADAASAGMDTFVILLTLLLLLPVYGVALLVTFAPLIALRGDARGGISAVAASIALVRSRFWSVAGRFTGWGALFFALSAIVSPLPVAQWLLPSIATLVSYAFTVVLYEELRGA